MLTTIFSRWRVVPGKESGPDETSLSNTHTSTVEEINLVGDQYEDMTNQNTNLQWGDLWALGISTAIGGHFYIWSVCFLGGFGSFVVAFFIVASGYGMLALCLAELSSALPFAGGAYGIARVTLGTLPGFLIGCFDAYQSMFNALYSILAMGVMINVIAEADRKWMPVWWVIIYSSYMIIHIIGGPWMWRTMKTLSMGSLCLLLIYILGSIKFADFDKYSPVSYPPDLTRQEQYFRGGIRMFLKLYPITCWFFLGTESINLASHDAANPKRDLPRGYLSTFATVFCTSTASIFIAASIYPGSTLLPYILNPTSLGYMLIFDINYRTATILALPGIYTAGLTYTYYYGSQIRAMGKSGLANSWLGYDVPGFKTPVVALLFGFVVGVLVGLRYFFWEPVPHEDLVSINLLGAAATYCSIFVSFIVFRLYYSSIKREFTSPLGIAGAVWGLLVFLLKFIILSGFESQPAIMIFAIYVTLLVIYYFLVVQKRQVFSEEEKTVLFKAYLIKTNRSKNARLRVGQARAHRPSPMSEGDEPAPHVPRSKPQRSASATSDEPSVSTRIYSGHAGAEASSMRVSSSSRSHSDDGDATVTVRLSGKFAVRESIPEDDRSHLSGDGFGEGGDASTSVLVAMDTAYTQVETECFDGDIELPEMQDGTPPPSALEALLPTDVSRVDP